MTLSSTRIEPDNYQAFCDPNYLKPLTHVTDAGLMNESEHIYRFMNSDHRVLDFYDSKDASTFEQAAITMYDAPASVEIYRNFLDWLFATFNINETSFRQSLIQKLQLSKGMKVLVTGCGFGDDLPIIHDIIGDNGELHAQDLSKSMVISASHKYKQPNIKFSISNALHLPYQSNYFDAVFHFGGINLFGNIKRAISEMNRVCKNKGIVLFGDEGIASHLRGTEYAEIFIKNNRLWSAEAPIALLPHTATNIELTYTLGNCFYLIKFTSTDSLPSVNLDIPHQGIRGGTARTRYFGQTEGLTPESKEALVIEARKRGTSIHRLLEEAVHQFLIQRPDRT